VETNLKSKLAGGNQLPDSPNATPPSAPGAQRFIVFLFDDLHLKMEEMVYAQKAGIKAIGEGLSDSDLAAVVSISGKTNSGLTRDQAKLQDTVMSLHPVTNSPPSGVDCPNIDYHQAYLIDTEHNPVALGEAMQQLMVCNPLLPASAAETTVEMAARRVLSIGDVDVQQTFLAISAYVRKMAKLPGQRALILISPGFFAMTPVALNSESSLIDLAAQSNVTISAIDARGLYVTEVNASDDLHGRSPALVAENRHRSMTNAENVMDELSDGTGGAYFHHNNDLDAGFKKLIEGPEYLYLIELPPENAKLDGSYHRLQVKVDRDGLQLQARRGYYAPKPEKGKK
jgi:VWFA-related protein